MKLKLLAIIVIIISFYTSIAGSELISEGILDSEIDGFSISRQEFGQTESIIYQNRVLYSRLLYPNVGINNVDRHILRWVNGIYQDAKDSMTAPRIKSAFAATGEISTDFNSYLIGKRYAGIEISGYYKERARESSYIIKTFNISIDGKRLLSNREILSPKYTSKILELLQNEMINADPFLSEYIYDIDESWLSNIVLVHEGVKVILESGKHLPLQIGTRSFILKYSDLGEAFRLPSQYFTGIAPFIIDPNKPMVALTFDDGPGVATEKILDLLEEYNSRATFCVLGNLVDKHSELVKRASETGNEIIGHSWNHALLTRLSPASMKVQLQDTNNAIFNITGKQPKFHRPTYGAVNDNLSNVSKELGLAMINWNIDTNDWKIRNADAIYEHIMENVRDGSVILCHDIHATTGEAMEKVIPALIEQGYQLVTISELFSFSDIEIIPGQLYKSRP